jgi:murein L,D-transpeptidase YafK
VGGLIGMKGRIELSRGAASAAMNRPWVVAMILLLAGAAPVRADDFIDPPLLSDVTADRVVVEKAVRRLTLFAGDRPLKVYRVALGRWPLGAKRQQGDQKTPEGQYRIDGHAERTNFHLALHISYPEAADRARAARMGRRPGGSILIHGLPSGWWFLGHRHLKYDWTDGCIAVTDAEIEELWRVVPDGTPIEIRP